MLDEGAPDTFARAADDIDHRCRKPYLVGQLGNFQRRGRRSFVRLDDDGVARNQSWPHLAAHKPSGIVPRRQRNDHAMGDALDPDLLVRIVRRNDISGDPARFLGRVG